MGDDSSPDKPDGALVLDIKEEKSPGNVSATTANTPSSLGGRSPNTPHFSSLTGSAKSQEDPRAKRSDSRGCTIVSGGKKHKVSFQDEVRQGAKVEEVREVRAFKNNMGCRCTLL
mmetsp:Transcript_98430/g.301071  ORF Transcript_98430/g.301071 Transcript_98430/m.301071 type:complete len:115 (-) Transcript_98430:61-405(-)